MTLSCKIVTGLHLLPPQSFNTSSKQCTEIVLYLEQYMSNEYTYMKIVLAYQLPEHGRHSRATTFAQIVSALHTTPGGLH